MGGWLLETAKMALYMSFPVGLFHYFNQPEYFEEYVISTKRKIYPKEDESHHERIEGFAQLLREKQEKEAREKYRKVEAEQQAKKLAAAAK